ncbi:UbiA family prenyltransferase [Ruminiclostridium josui]|uniref:UbiA family prenyltransferase n=1 Tax=Ruminiclostridium josui TaxID=1499 RepID=UPI0004B40ED9
MVIGRFLNYVEIKTKITSTFAFLITMAYLFYIGSPVDWRLTLIFFASMFIFDMTTTAINNYIDSKTNHQSLGFKRKIALAIIFVMLGISTALGLYLAYLSDVVVLLIGAVCFMCGILYTFGPIPISRQPLGEIFSGLFYGLLIPFILLYINLPEDTLLKLSLNFTAINLQLNIMPLFTVVLLSVPPVCTTANIMLANNICDLERDITVKRFTLPYYLGKRKSVYLFAGLYYLGYLDIILMVVLGKLPWVCLLSLATVYPVQKNINQFFKVQDKAKTFIVSIKNYVLIMGALSLMIFIGGLSF